MKRNHSETCLAIIVATLIAGIIAFLMALVVAVVSGANAQQPCPGVVVGGGNVNVRSTPSTLGNSPVGTLAAGTPAPAFAAVAGWHPLCGGNYISGSVVTYSTNTPRPTSRATTVPVTPTRIQTNTPIPAAERTHTAQQYAEEICWLPPGAPVDSRGVCSTYPFGSRFTWRTIQIQP